MALSLRERITYWCYDHPTQAAVALYLVVVIPAVVVTMIVVSESGRAAALPIVLMGPVVPAVGGYSAWRGGPPEEPRARPVTAT